MSLGLLASEVMGKRWGDVILFISIRFEFKRSLFFK